MFVSEVEVSESLRSNCVIFKTTQQWCLYNQDGNMKTFWDCQCHDLALWECFLLIVWLISILCHKVCELVLNLVG